MRPICFSLAWLLAAAVCAAARPQRNVILILTDNHGPWTLGCYGNPDIRTPHIDQLAAEGVRFTRAYANNPVCSPNRATLLTGLMPSQHGVHCFLRAGLPQIGEGAYCTIREFPSLPKILKSRGYACGLVGKWHLGANLQPQEGFDDYWITMPHGATATFFDAKVIENGSERTEPEHLTRFWTRHALKFIEQNRERPFFLYLAYNGPYGLGKGQIAGAERAPHMGDYADSPMKSFPRTAMHPWQHDNKDFLNNDLCIHRYAAELTTIDDGVGEVMGKLRELGIDGDTIVVFTGDNGWAGGQHGLWGMGDHTVPLSAFEFTMTVPLIWWQKGMVKPRSTSDLMVSHRDFLPSMLDHLGIPDAVAGKDRERLTGRSYASVLRGDAIKDWDNTVFYEFETLRCIRTATMKWIERRGDEIDELYDEKADPGETRNLADDPAFGTQKIELKARLDQFFNRHGSPEFDLWKGGRSKAQLISERKGK